MILNLGCTTESPGDFEMVLVPRTCPGHEVRTLEMGRRNGCCFKFPGDFSMLSKIENYVLAHSSSY